MPVDTNEELFELGRIALQKQSAYLQLKIEKELAGKGLFDKEDELLKANAEWQKASADYRNMFDESRSNTESA